MREIIEHTLEMVAEQYGDPCPLVYARLFDTHPAMKPLFDNDPSGAVRGHMFNTAVDTLLDLAGDNDYAANMLLCESINHENIGVPKDVFPVFFQSMADTFRTLLRDAWSPDDETAWATVLSRVHAATA